MTRFDFQILRITLAPRWFASMPFVGVEKQFRNRITIGGWLAQRLSTVLFDELSTLVPLNDHEIGEIWFLGVRDCQTLRRFWRIEEIEWERVG